MIGTLTAKSRWRWAVRLASVLFFAVIAYFLQNYLRATDWESVASALARLPWQTLVGAASLACFSYGLYSCYDLLGRHITRHNLRAWQVMSVNFISYAFTLSIGSVIGGVALRLRLYSRFGLTLPVIAQVAMMSIVTNWLGYLTLAGIVLVGAPLSLPPQWRHHADAVQAAGFAFLACIAVYLLVCLRARRRTWRLRNYRLTLPTGRFALLQIGMAAANWALMAAVVFVLLERQVSYPEVVLALLAAAVTGVVVRVPAGIGVLEAVFFMLMARQVAHGELLAALLAYRAVYYLGPLLVAALFYLLFEAQLRRRGTLCKPSTPA